MVKLQCQNASGEIYYTQHMISNSTLSSSYYIASGWIHNRGQAPPPTNLFSMVHVSKYIVPLIQVCFVCQCSVGTVAGEETYWSHDDSFMRE